MFRRLVILAIAIVVFAAVGLAVQRYPAPIRHLQADGIRIAGSFEAPGGLKGYVGLYNEQPLEIYLTPDGDHALLGTLLDAQGESFAEEHLARATADGL